MPARLSAQQKALLLAYAELEDDTPGTVNGITYTKGGKPSLLSPPTPTPTPTPTPSSLGRESKDSMASLWLLKPKTKKPTIK